MITIMEYQKEKKLVIKLKLPKLSITKFDELFENWLPFWNKFEAEIDSTIIPAVTKFAYLKELVELKLTPDIDGLSLNSEGYTLPQQYSWTRLLNARVPEKFDASK